MSSMGLAETKKKMSRLDFIKSLAGLEPDSAHLALIGYITTNKGIMLGYIKE